MRRPPQVQALRCLLVLPLLAVLLGLAAGGPYHAHGGARHDGSGIEAQAAEFATTFEHDCLACRLAHVKTALPRPGGGIDRAPEARLSLRPAIVVVARAADSTPSAPRAPPAAPLTRQ